MIYHNNIYILKQFPDWWIGVQSYFARFRRFYLRKIHRIQLHSLQDSTIANMLEPPSLDDWLKLPLPRIYLEWMVNSWMRVDVLKLEDWLYRYIATDAAVFVGEDHFYNNIHSKERLAYVLGHIPLFEEASPGQDYEFRYGVYRWNDVLIESWDHIGEKMCLPSLCEECAGKLAAGMHAIVLGRHVDTRISRHSCLVSHRDVLETTVANPFRYCRFCRVRPLYKLRRGRKPANQR